MQSSSLNCATRTVTGTSCGSDGALWLVHGPVDACSSGGKVHLVAPPSVPAGSQPVVPVPLAHQGAMTRHVTLRFQGAQGFVLLAPHCGSPASSFPLPDWGTSPVLCGAGCVRQAGGHFLLSACVLTQGGFHWLAATCSSTTLLTSSCWLVTLAASPAASAAVDLARRVAPGHAPAHCMSMSADRRFVAVSLLDEPSASAATPAPLRGVVVLHRPQRSGPASKAPAGGGTAAAASAAPAAAAGGGSGIMHCAAQLLPASEGTAGVLWHSALPSTVALGVSATGRLRLWREGANEDGTAFQVACSADISQESPVVPHPLAAWLQTSMQEAQFLARAPGSVGWASDGHCAGSPVLQLPPRGLPMTATQCLDAERQCKHVLLYTGGAVALSIEVHRLHSDSASFGQPSTVALPALPASEGWQTLHAFAAGVPLNHAKACRPLPLLTAVDGGAVTDGAGALRLRFDALADVGELADSMASKELVGEHVAADPDALASLLQADVAERLAAAAGSADDTLPADASLADVLAARMRMGVLPEQVARPDDISLVLCAQSCVIAVQGNVRGGEGAELWRAPPLSSLPEMLSSVAWAGMTLTADVTALAVAWDLAWPSAGSLQLRAESGTTEVPLGEHWLHRPHGASPLLVVACSSSWQLYGLQAGSTGTLGVAQLAKGTWGAVLGSSTQWHCTSLRGGVVTLQLPGAAPDVHTWTLDVSAVEGLAAAASAAPCPGGCLHPTPLSLLVRCGHSAVAPVAMALTAALVTVRAVTSADAQSLPLLSLQRLMGAVHAEPELPSAAPGEVAVELAALAAAAPLSAPAALTAAAAASELTGTASTHLAIPAAVAALESAFVSQWSERVAEQCRSGLAAATLQHVSVKDSLALLAFNECVELTLPRGVPLPAGSIVGGLSLDAPGRVAAWGLLAELNSNRLSRLGTGAVGELPFLPVSPFAAVDVAWAAVSDSQRQLLALLMQWGSRALGITAGGTQAMLWWHVRASHAALWLEDARDVGILLAAVAAGEFLASGRNPYAAVLWYVLCGPTQVRVAAALLASGVPDTGTGLPGGVTTKDIVGAPKIAAFLKRDFAHDAKARRNAAANAMALLGAHRHHMAVAFMLLAHQPQEAAGIALRYCNDASLAVLVLRVGAEHYSEPGAPLHHWLRAVPPETAAAPDPMASGVFEDFDFGGGGGGGIFDDFDAAPLPGAAAAPLEQAAQPQGPAHSLDFTAAVDALLCELRCPTPLQAVVEFLRDFHASSGAEAGARFVAALDSEADLAHPALYSLSAGLLAGSRIPRRHVLQHLADQTHADAAPLQARLAAAGEAALALSGVHADEPGLVTVAAQQQLMAAVHLPEGVQEDAAIPLLQAVRAKGAGCAAAAVLDTSRAAQVFLDHVRSGLRTRQWGALQVLLGPARAVQGETLEQPARPGVVALAAACGALSALLLPAAGSTSVFGSVAWGLVLPASAREAAARPDTPAAQVLLSLLELLTWRRALARLQQFVRVASRALPRCIASASKPSTPVASAGAGGASAAGGTGPLPLVGRLAVQAVSDVSQPLSPGEAEAAHAALADTVAPALAKAVSAARRAALQCLAEAGATAPAFAALLHGLLSPAAFGGRRRTLIEALSKPAAGLRLPEASALDALWCTCSGPAALWDVLATFTAAAQYTPAVPTGFTASLQTPAQQMALFTPGGAKGAARHAATLTGSGLVPHLGQPQPVSRSRGDFHSAVAAHSRLFGFLAAASGQGVAKVEAGARLSLSQRSGAALPSSPPTSPTLGRSVDFLASYLPLCMSPMAPRAGMVTQEDAAIVAPLDALAGTFIPRQHTPRVDSLSMSVVPVGAGSDTLPPSPLQAAVAATGRAATDISAAAAVTRLDMHPTQPLFLSGGVAEQVILWDQQRATGVWRYKPGAARAGAGSSTVSTARVAALRWGPHGDSLAALMDDSTLHMWSAAENGVCTLSQPLDLAATAALAFLASPFILAAAGTPSVSSMPQGASRAAPANASNVHVLDTRAHGGAGAVVVTARVGKGAVTCLAPLLGSGLLCGGADGSLQRLDLRMLTSAATATASHSGKVTALETLPGGMHALSGGVDGTVKLWHGGLGAPLQSLQVVQPATFMGHKLLTGLFSTVGITDLSVAPGFAFACGADGLVQALPLHAP